MVDLGVYNHVRHAFANGKSEDEIRAQLVRGGQLTAEMAEEAIQAVKDDKPPKARGALLAMSSEIAPQQADASQQPHAFGRASVSAYPVHRAAISTASGVKRPSKALRFIAWFAFICALIAAGAYYLQPDVQKLRGLLQVVSQRYQASQQQVPAR